MRSLQMFLTSVNIVRIRLRSGDLMDNVSASQPRDRGFEHHTCHDHDSSYESIVNLLKEWQPSSLAIRSWQSSNLKLAAKQPESGSLAT